MSPEGRNGKDLSKTTRKKPQKEKTMDDWRREHDEAWVEFEEKVSKEKPQSIPPGCVLVTMTNWSHNSGFPNSCRFVAVPKGAVILGPEGEVTKVEEETDISFPDCNGIYRYKLPKHSWEYVEGAWVPRRRVKYYY
jgi:hypothetical protein